METMNWHIIIGILDYDSSRIQWSTIITMKIVVHTMQKT